MKVYVAQPEKHALGKSEWPRRFALFANFFIVHLAISLLWRSPGDSLPVQIFGSLFFAIFMSVIFSVILRHAWTIHVDEDGVTASIGKLRTRSLRFDAVKSVAEKNANLYRGAGLLLSQHGAVGRFLWGGVWIPASLEDYGQVRAFIASKVNPTVDWPERPV